MASNKLAAEKVAPTLMGGWMPSEWWGNDPKGLKLPKTKRAPVAPVTVPLLSREQIDSYRLRTNALGAIVKDNLKRGVCGGSIALPFRLDTQIDLPGEHFFLILCQFMYREAKCKEALAEQMAGEDFLQRIVQFWAQEPLVADNIYAAMEGTSVEDGD